MRLVEITKKLAADVDTLSFSFPIATVYNPLDYAWEPHAHYLQRYGRGRKEILLLGMNPGPWGMAQTGVPFGEVEAVRNWLGIAGRIDQPKTPHPKKPVEGFSCRRSEVSGKRLWGWAQACYDSANRFFQRFFVMNYCPLLFLEASGRNRTPDKLAAAERKKLYAICDAALAEMTACFQPDHVIGVGRFAYQRAGEALAGQQLKISLISHPSPANPKANTGWGELVSKELAAIGITI